jgi:hypothetical protein
MLSPSESERMTSDPFSPETWLSLSEVAESHCGFLRGFLMNKNSLAEPMPVLCADVLGDVNPMAMNRKSTRDYDIHGTVCSKRSSSILGWNKTAGSVPLRYPCHGCNADTLRGLAAAPSGSQAAGGSRVWCRDVWNRWGEGAALEFRYNLTEPSLKMGDQRC